MNLNEMRDEAYTTSKSKGWYEQGRRDVPVLLSLIHSEASEALEAWRESGDEGIAADACRTASYQEIANGAHFKPEGVAAELADVVIRVGDMAGAYGLDLNHSAPHYKKWNGADFPTRIGYLHLTISDALSHWDTTRSEATLAFRLLNIILETTQIAEDWKIDLDAAVRAKMAFNKTRPHRHGGKRV